MNTNITWQHVILVAIFVGAVVALAVTHIISGGAAAGFLAVLTGAGSGIVGVSVGGNTATSAANQAATRAKQQP